MGNDKEQKVCRGCFNPDAEHDPRVCLRKNQERDRVDAQRYRALKFWLLTNAHMLEALPCEFRGPLGTFDAAVDLLVKAQE